MAALRAVIVEGFASATAAKDLSALRRLLHCNYKVGLLTREQYERLTDFDSVKSSIHAPAGHYLSIDDIAALIETCRADRNVAKGTRDAALVLSACSSGVRRHELVAFRTAALDLPQGYAHLTETKGGKPRTTYLHSNACAAIEAWMEIRGPGSEFVLLPVTRGGNVAHDRHLSAHQVWKMVHERARQAGLPATVSTHDFRRFAVSHLLETTDLVLVSRIVGHKSPETTARYDRRPDIRAREAVETRHCRSGQKSKCSPAEQSGRSGPPRVRTDATIVGPTAAS